AHPEVINVERALHFGKDRGIGKETAKPSEVNVLEVIAKGETVFDAQKSPSLDAKDKLELEEKHLHSSLFLNTYKGEANPVTLSDSHSNILPGTEPSQVELQPNQIGDLKLDKQNINPNLISCFIETDKLEGNNSPEEASQRYNIQYPHYQACFYPHLLLNLSPYAALFNHVEDLGSSLKNDEFDKINDGNKVLCNNALEEIRKDREGPILYTHSEGIGEGQSTSRPPLFDGTNYSYWKERMRIYIRSTNFQLWLVIKNGEEIPMKKVGETTVPKTENEFDAEDIKKIKNYAKAINMLYCTVNPDDYRKISCCTTAKEMWDKLEVTYEGTDQVREAKIDFLTQEYEMF
ncbi:unnamed protein product, partial [Cuscuta campestris]